MDPKKDDQSSGTKPWDQSFGDDRDDQGNLSRTKRHRQSHNNRLITIVLVAIIILIAVGSLIYGLARQSAMNKPETSMDVSSEQVSSSSQKKEKKVAKSAAQKASSTSKESTASSRASERSASRSAAKASSRAAASQSEAAASSSKAVTSSSSAATTTAKSSSSKASSTTSGSKYATVGQGQGVYRVAVNNGISVQKLLELNGLSSGATLTPGQKLRVK